MGEVVNGRSAVALGMARRAGFTFRERRSLPFAIAALVALVLVNVVVFFAPIDYRAFGGLAYPGVFLITFIANATTFIPVPYLPVVMHVARTAEFLPLVIVLGALGSVLGESVAFAFGRAEEHAVQDHRWYQRLHELLARPVRAGVFLFLFAVPLNPFFDVAGLAAGALGVPYRVFFVSVFLGRIVRLALVVWLGVRFGLD